MNTKKSFIKIPKELVEDMNLNKDSKLVIRVEEDGALLAPVNSSRIHLPWKALGSVVLISLVTFFLVFKDYRQIPLTGPLSIATIVILVGGIGAMMNFTYFFIKNKRTSHDGLYRGIYWRNFPTVFLSFMIIMVLGLLMVFRIVGELFVGASFDIYTSTLIGSLFVAVINLLMIHVAQALTPSTMIKSLIAIILGGVVLAMITNKDQQWWLYNLSFLGTPEASNAWQFNLTLLLSAFLMIALIDYIFVLLYDLLGPTKRLVVLKYILIATAICLGGVGFFPYNESNFNQTMHNRTAGYLVYLFILMIITLRWLLPEVGKSFMKFSYGVGAALLVCVFLFQGVNYLSLTAFELFAFVLAFTWLLMLLRILVNMVMRVGKVYDVELVLDLGDEE